MKKAGIIGGLSLLALAFGLLLSLGVVAGTIGDDDGGASDLEPNPPERPECNCPLVYDPVVCDVNGERQIFSNACFAGCAGATRCRSFATTLN